MVSIIHPNRCLPLFRGCESLFHVGPRRFDFYTERHNLCRIIFNYIGVGVGIGVENRIPISTPIPTPTPNEWRLCGITYDVRYNSELDPASESNRMFACVKHERDKPQIPNLISAVCCATQSTDTTETHPSKSAPLATSAQSSVAVYQKGNRKARFRRQ
jgi:hypothetical protein